MFLYYERKKQDPTRSNAVAFSIDSEGIRATNTQISSFDGRYSVKVENGLERMEDIMAALQSENVVVYNTTQEIGYWKDTQVENTQVEEAPAKKTRKRTTKKQEEEAAPKEEAAE